MTVERGLRLAAGLITGASAVLAAWHSPYGLFLTRSFWACGCCCRR